MAPFVRAAGALALVFTVACSATPNPDASELRPVEDLVPMAPAEPRGGARAPEPEAARAGGESTGEAGGAAQSEGPLGPPPTRPEPPEEEPAARGLDGPILIGRAGSEPIDVRDLLLRLWVRENARTREALEHLVLSQLTVLEADRLGVTLDERLALAKVDEAWDAMRSLLAERGMDMTVEEHVRERYDMDPERYGLTLRRDAIVQLLAERCVRAWALESPRAVVRVMELDDPDAVEAVRSGLAAGTDFVALARTHDVRGEPERAAETIELVRSEHRPLTRLAFATPVGEVGGPLADAGRFLMVEVVERHEGAPGPWSAVGIFVESSLKERPVDDLEYVQWRDAMLRRYAVDLDPLLSLLDPTAR